MAKRGKVRVKAKKRSVKIRGGVPVKEDPKEKVNTILKGGKEIRIGSGVTGFDRLIQGGFRKNSINVLVGNAGSGKTIFAMEFLFEGLRKGESCLYITFEEKKEEFYKNMAQFGWDLYKFEAENKFFFLEYSPERVKTMLEEGGGTVETIILKNHISRIVIDSITSFTLLFDDELAKREAALSLFDIIRKWNCISILTLEENPAKRCGGESSAIEFEADSIILAYFIRTKKIRERFIEILKMRGTKHSTEIHAFDIGSKGITIRNKLFGDHLNFS